MTTLELHGMYEISAVKAALELYNMNPKLGLPAHHTAGRVLKRLQETTK